MESKLRIGDVVVDTDGCVGIVLIRYADGDLCSIENDSTHPNPKKCGKDDVTRFAGDESFREMVGDALESIKQED